MVTMWLAVAALADPAQDFGDAVEQLGAAVAAVRDATFVLHQLERVNGKLQDPVVMDVRYQAPNTVYVTFHENGRRLLWIPGENGDQMRVDLGPYLPTISLAPDSSLARHGQRHTIRRMGLAPVAALFAADLARIKADPERLRPDVTVLPPTTRYGRPAQCFVADMRRDLEPKLYGDRVQVCLDADTHLPLEMTTWEKVDGELQQVETYGYEGLKVNVGLTPADFDSVALGF